MKLVIAFSYFIRQKTLKAVGAYLKISKIIDHVESGELEIIESADERGGFFHYPLSVLKQKLWL